MTVIHTRSPGGATEANQGTVISLLQALATELAQKYEGGAIALDAPTLEALENITATISGAVDLSPATLAALETVNSQILNFPADYPNAALLSKVEEVRALLDAPLEVEVNNFPPGGSASEVSVTNLPLDVFANLVTGQRDNQIEVHFDDVNYANYLTHTTAGGGSGGSRVQANGQVRYHSGTAATGRIQGTTLDVVKYRPMHEVYAGWTAAFLTAGSANSWQRVGMFTDTDGVFVGYEGVSFGITQRNGGSVTHVDRASWSDPCDGSPGSAFTRNGVPEALDPAKQNIWRVRLGWLGSAGFTVEVLTPDWQWIPVYTLKHANASDLPFLANADLPMAVDVGKTSGATDFAIATNCWAGGTTSPKARLSDTITDRSLAETVRAVISGKTTGGGGGYVDVKVTPSGAVVADVSGSTVTLDATTLAALETITVLVQSGQVIGLDASTLAALENITAAVTGTVALDGPTLAALETITAAVSNFPTDYPDVAAQASLAAILAALGGTIAVSGPLTDAQLRAAPVEVTGTVTATLGEIEVKNDAGNPVPVSGMVALDAPTLAALETITILVQSGQVIGLDAATLAALEEIVVSGTVEIGATSLAALENINAAVTGTVALDAPTLAALESITATVSNFPTDYPLPAGQIATLTPQTDALTDVELRAAPVEIVSAGSMPTLDSTDDEYGIITETVTAAGDTILKTPAAGNRIRLRWVYAINNPTSTVAPLIKVRLGVNEVFRVWAVMKRQKITGPVDGALVVNLSENASVAVTIFYEEIT